EVLGRAPAQLLDDHGGRNAVFGAACPEGGQQRFQTRTTRGVLEHIVKLLALQAPADVVGGHEGTFVVGNVGPEQIHFRLGANGRVVLGLGTEAAGVFFVVQHQVLHAGFN